MSSSSMDKKDICVETTAIDPFSLAFASDALELQWQRRNLPRQKDISIRYFSAACMFQLLFLWADHIDLQPFLWVSLARMSLALMSAVVALLIASSIITPRPKVLFWITLSYAFPTLMFYSLQKPILSHWDSLFLVYGLCFLTLPQVSPLNFFLACIGSGSCIGVYLGGAILRLSADQWVLSSLFLAIIDAMLCYIAYSSEKSARERWLLRQRLGRERISIELRPLPVEDSLERGGVSAVLEISTLLHSLAQFTHTRQHPSPTTQQGGEGSKERLLKGILAWCLCTAVGYVIDAMQNPPPSEFSKPFSLFMHTVGFSMFLVVATGQVRWVFFNGIAGLLLMWLFTQVLPQQPMAFWAHSLGYLVLGGVVLGLVGVFGGVVLVWSQLLEYVRDLLTKYPQLQDDVKTTKLLEQVLVRHIGASLQDTKILSRTPSDPHLSLISLRQRPNLTDEMHARNEELTSNPPLPSAVTCEASHQQQLMAVLRGRKLQSCYFCLHADARFYVPACNGWQQVHGGLLAEQQPNSPVPMCTPYASLLKTRDSLQSQLQQQAQRVAELEARSTSLEADVAATRLRMNELHQRLALKDQQTTSIVSRYEQQLRMERAQHEDNVSKLLHTINCSVHKIKELQKGLHRTQKAQNNSSVDYPPSDQETTLQGATLEEAVSQPPPEQIMEEIVAIQPKKPRLSGTESNEFKSPHPTLSNPFSLPEPGKEEFEGSEETFWLQPLEHLQDAVWDWMAPDDPQHNIRSCPEASGPLQLIRPRRMQYARCLELEGIKEDVRLAQDDMKHALRNVCVLEDGKTDFLFKGTITKDV